MTAPSDVNDQKVLEVLAGAEMMRRVQIADKLDATTDDVQAILAGLLAVGDIVETDGFAPNGLECKFYSLSPTFRRSGAFKPMEAKAAAASFPVTPGATRVERALAFIRARGANGSATTAELHALLGLEATEYVSTVLASAVRTSRLVKDGKTWTVGAGPGTAPAQSVGSLADDQLPEALVSQLSKPARMQAIADSAKAAQDRAADHGVYTIKGATAALLGAHSTALSAELKAIATGESMMTVGYGVPPAERASGIRASRRGTGFADAPPADSPLGQAMAAALGEVPGQSVKEESAPTEQVLQAPATVIPNLNAFEEHIRAQSGLSAARNCCQAPAPGLVPVVAPIDGAISNGYGFAVASSSSGRAGDTPADHPPLEQMLGETKSTADNVAAFLRDEPFQNPIVHKVAHAEAPPDVDDDHAPFSSDLNLDPAASPVTDRFFSDAPLPLLDITVRTDLRDPLAADRRESSVAVTAVAPLRFGVWSDGFVELERAGVKVATLTRADADALADHMLSLRGGSA